MATREHDVLDGQPLSPETQPDLPKLPHLHPLDLVLLASLQPAFAQMLGLYFADTSVAAGVLYDYLLLADPTGVLGGSAASALAWLAFTADPAEVDAVLVTGRGTAMRAAIAPPAAGKAYALPGPAVRQADGTFPEVAGQVGLWWPLPPESTTDEQPDRLVFYLPRRAALGLNPTPSPPVTPPADTAYSPLPDGTPILVSEPEPTVPATPPNPRSSDWPTPDLPIYLVDGNLAEGWYSYRFRGQDLFGRQSPLGPPAAWYQWDPPPRVPPLPPLPLPWYYEKTHPGYHSIHPFAVALLDKLAPPPPLGAEAWTLDPLGDPPDRWVLVDALHTAWRTANPHLVGLRVRWRFTYLQQLQALDTREFRVYYRAGRWNALLGRVVSVAAVVPVSGVSVESDVTLDFADSKAANAFAGTRLRVGNSDFLVVGSQAGAQLGLRVQNLGAGEDVLPKVGKLCTLALPEGHPLWIDPGVATNWALRLAIAPYEPPARVVYDPEKDSNGQLLTSENPAFQNVHLAVTGPNVVFDPGPKLAGLQPWLDHLWLRTGSAEEAHRIVRYDDGTHTITLEAAPALAPPFDAWVVGRPTREYDLFVPAPDVGLGEPFAPSYAEPSVYAQIGVSAADDKPHVADASQWPSPLGGRTGNESRLSPSATVYRVLQATPAAPDLADPSERRYATPADYHSRSYSTFRFVPVDHLKLHVLRAVEDSLFQRDRRIRETRSALNPLDPPPPTLSQPNPPPNPHLEYFPAGWDVAKRQAVATVLNLIGPGTNYAGLSTDAWTVLARLPGNEGFAGTADPLTFPIPALSDRDWLVRRTRTSLLAAESALFPASWNSTQIGNVVADLAGLPGIPGGYAGLSDNALRILAGLPGNETAFTQVTLAPLEMTDPTIQDERRPDDDAGYMPATSGVRAYTDTLPGRATNRYFYRARFVDGAQNQGFLSLAGPVVYLRKVEPPRAPVITGAVAGDREITLLWSQAPSRISRSTGSTAG
ncbi:MAG TPA: hypothetical protein VGR07_00495, partial [Thermoanaerobaculia bacterium]|nr:hypothetical protein [Thermoanaerobaculia bacterium]